MPDSILPLMTQNNRLDCIDFIENKMEAKVRNLFDEYVELVAMNDRYLKLRTSEKCELEVALMPRDTAMVICVANTCYGPAADTELHFYTLDWKATDMKVSMPELEEYFTEEANADESSLQNALAQLKDFSMVKKSLLPDEPRIRFELQLHTLDVDTKKAVQKYVQPVVR